MASQINDIIAGIGSGGGNTNSTGGEETNSVETNSVDTNSVEETNTVDTNTIDPEPEPPDPLPDDTISIGDPQWQPDGTANVSVTSSEGSYIIQYQINGTEEGSWLTVSGGNVTGVKHGDTVYARLTDGEQYSTPQNKKIEDIIPPQVTVTAQGSPSTKSITVTVQASDNESGMVASPTYTFQYKQSGAGSYTTPSDASNVSSATYTFTGLTQGTTYDIQVVVNGDVAGNTGTGTTQATTTTVPGADAGLETGNITASPVTWSNYKASITLTAHVTGFQIQYQVNETDESGWSEAANSPVTVRNLDHGNTVYARLTDGVNAGDYAAINILDRTAPTVSVKLDEVTDSTIKVTVTAIDGQSGLASTNAYKYYLNEEENPRETSSSNTYTYKELTASTPYNINVEVVDKGNNSGTGTVQTSTVEPPAYIDSVLPSAPMLGEGMTPVKWDGNNWIKTTVTDNEWYDYSNKEWANVVLDDAEFNDNILNENKPYSMFVWIPRYAYQITSQYHQSGASGGNINIVFIDIDNKGKDGKIYSEAYPTYNTGSGMSDFVVHPAFNYGNNKENKLRGLWIGKFDSSSQEGNQNNSRGDDVTNKTVQIKAGVSCWRYIKISNIHTVCTEMNKEGNIYGLNSDDNIVDPHMLKNSEWGAITYLSYNKQYGQGNINRNNNSNYITGIGSDTTSTTTTTTSTKNNYKTTYGQRASTTGNVTGIYDTVGGAAKYSAAYVSRADSNGSSLANSENRYKEVYPLYWSIRPSNGWYGDAIYETSSSGSDKKGSWFEESAIFIQEVGGGYVVRGATTAMFGFGWDAGQPADYIGFRVVISVM